MEELRGKYALVTGASSGLGVDFTDILASAGCHLVLVARRQDRLKAQKKVIQDKYGVRVHIIPMDLGIPDSPQTLYNRIKEMGVTIDVLINNAGVGVFGHFIDISWEQEKNMLNLDITNLVHMTKLFVKDMVQQNFGYILNIASIGAYQPTPLYASYSAAKSFVLNFTEALNFELRHTNVKVTALTPGVTETEFIQTAGQNKLTLFQKYSMMKSYPVAKIGIEALLKGKPNKIAGFNNTLSMLFQGVLPRRFKTIIAYWAVKS